MDYPKFSLPSPLGTIKLTVSYSEFDQKGQPPKQYFYMELGNFRLNGKVYESAKFDFSIQDYRSVGGPERQNYGSLRAYLVNSLCQYDLTESARTKIRAAFEDAFKAFKATPEYDRALEKSIEVQRAQVVEMADGCIKSLEEKIEKFKALRFEVFSNPRPISETQRMIEILNRH